MAAFGAPKVTSKSTLAAVASAVAASAVAASAVAAFRAAAGGGSATAGICAHPRAAAVEWQRLPIVVRSRSDL